MSQSHLGARSSMTFGLKRCIDIDGDTGDHSISAHGQV